MIVIELVQRYRRPDMLLNNLSKTQEHEELATVMFISLNWKSELCIAHIIKVESHHKLIGYLMSLSAYIYLDLGNVILN